MQHNVSNYDGPKLLKDAQKSYVAECDYSKEGRVYIPENIEESDSESDSFGKRLRKLNEDGQTSKQSGKNDQVWFLQVNEDTVKPMEKPVYVSKMVPASDDAMMDKRQADPILRKLNDSPEIFLPDDNIIHTQDSQAHDGDICMEEMVPQETIVAKALQMLIPGRML